MQRRRVSTILTMWLIGLVIGLVTGLSAAQAPADEGWELRQQDPATQTRVWIRPRPDALPAFRAHSVIEARLASLAAVLLDEARTQDWVYRARRTVLLQRDGPTRGRSLVITAMPFPLADREAVVDWELRQDPQTGVVTLRGHGNSEDGPAPAEDRVRMRNVESSWTLTPRPDGAVDVLFEGQGDPGGNLDSPLLRSFAASAVWEAPWETMLGLRRIVQEPGYAAAQLPFIREPARP